MQVSSHALRTISERKMHQFQRLPLASNLQKMQVYMYKTVENVSPQLQQVHSCCWLMLHVAHAMLAQIVLFDPRHGAEAQRPLCDSYNHCSHYTEEDVACGLSLMQQKLVNKFIKVNKIGK